MTLTDMLAASTQRRGDAPALSDGITRVTYAELVARTEAVARWLLARGLHPGDRVAFALPNVVEFGDWYYGVVRAGAVAVPINPVLRPAEIAAQLRHAGVSLLVTWPELTAPLDGARVAGVESIVVTPGTGPAGYLAGLANAASVDLPDQASEDDLAVLLFTSGTTSTPKAAMLSHRNLVVNALSCTEALNIVGDDVLLGSLPLFHAFGQTVCLSVMLSAGGHTVLQPRFNPRAALPLVAEEGVTIIAAVPSMFTALAQHHERAGRVADLSTVRFAVSGGAPLAPETYRRLIATLDFRLIEGYGLSECSPVVAINQAEENRPGSVGTALDVLTVGVVDPATGTPLGHGQVGELTVAGPCVMLGYWRDPEATAAVLSPDGVLRTGDMARIDDDGYIEIVDRRKELVIVGGENVYPREVEDVLLTHPAVADCAVLGVPHPSRGEVVVAAVVLADGASATEREIRDHVRAHLAGFKVPRRVWFPTELPLGTTGKILKRAITIPEDVRPHLS